ncbi:MAG TPA: hypothetical protein VM658_13000 [bacterium]|nr:hypothetical protein [bacterium]
MDDNQFVKKAFFDHLGRQGFTAEHLAAYGEYFDFFLSHLGAAKVMDLEPELIYRQALLSVNELDGEDVIEAYMQLLQYFMEFWSERWEAMHPEEYSEEALEKK